MFFRTLGASASSRAFEPRLVHQTVQLMGSSTKPTKLKNAAHRRAQIAFPSIERHDTKAGKVGCLLVQSEREHWRVTEKE